MRLFPWRMPRTFAIKPEGWDRIYWTMVLAIPWYQSAGGEALSEAWGFSRSLDDEDRFVVDQGFVAVVTQMTVLLNRVIQQ